MDIRVKILDVYELNGKCFVDVETEFGNMTITNIDGKLTCISEKQKV